MKKITQILSSFKKELAKRRTIINLSFSIYIISITILIFCFLEEIFYFNTDYRKIIFFFNSFLVASILLYNFFNWLINHFGLFNNNSNEQAALIIGNFYPNIKDKLLNVLQLNKVNHNLDLTILATKNISVELKKIDFKNFFSKKLSYNNSVLFYASSIIIIGMIYIFYFDSCTRLIKYNEDFPPPIPFTLHSLKKDIYAENGENLSVIFYSKNKSPDSINVFWKNNNHILNKKIGSLNDTFSYTINNVKSNLIYWAEYESPQIISKWDSIKTKEYDIEIIERPYFKNIELIISPPLYSNTPNIVHDYKKSNHINLLPGSKVSLSAISNTSIIKSWLETNTDSISQIIELQTNNMNSVGEFHFNENMSIKLFCININNIKNINPVEYKFYQINDYAPTITINSPKEEFILDESYTINLNANINDDYGIADLGLVYTIKAQEGLEQISNRKDTVDLKQYINQSKNISILKAWDIQNIPILMGDELHFWIYATDNNPENPKTSESNIIVGKFPSLEDLFTEIEEYETNNLEILDEMEESIDEVIEDINEIELELLKTENISFEEQKKLEENIEEINNVYQQIEQLQENIEKIIEQAEKNNLFDDKLLEKFGQFQNMLQEIMSEELLQSIENLKNSMQKMDQQQMLDALQNFEFNVENFENELDRFIDMFEMAKAEQKLNELSEMMENMLEKQIDINNQLNNNDSKINTLTAKSNKQENRFEKFENILNEATQSIKSISENASNQLDDLQNSEMVSETEQMLNKTSEKIKNNDTNAAKESSQNAEENLNEIQETLEEIKEDFLQEEMQKIMSDFMIIIDNLLTISYQQEKLIDLSNGVRSNSPLLREINFKQNNLELEMNQILNQLTDLSAKTFFVDPKIGRSFGKIKSELNKIKSSFAQKKVSSGRTAQKKAIQNINNIILLLLNSLEELQNSESLSGFEQFLESMQAMSEQQQSINQSTMQLSQLGLSDQQSLLNELLSQQQQLKQQLEEMLDNGSGDNTGSLDKISEDMDEVIQDLLNNNVNPETIERQQEILSRMLDSQKSMEKKDFSKKRESKTNTQDYINLGPDGLPTNLGEKDLLLINAMEEAMEEGYSEEYNQYIRKYFLKLQQLEK